MRFTYTAKQGPQNTREGVIEADSVDKAIARVFAMGLTPLEVRQAGARGKILTGQQKTSSVISWERKVSRLQIALFTRQVSDLLSAGIPLLEALRIIQRQIRHQRFYAAIGEMTAIVRDGGTFSSALAWFPGIFSGLYVNMVRSGETAGNLAGVMSRLAGFIERDHETRSKIQSALLYPALVLAAGAVTIFVLLTWVIPNITTIFDDMNQGLPWPTLTLVALSGFLARFWPVVICGMALVVLGVKRFYASEQGRMRIDNGMLNVPGLGNFVHDVQVARCARTLGTLLESGVDILAALRSVTLIVENQRIKTALELVSERVAKGAGLAEAVQEQNIFSDLVVSMISVGEQSGETHKGLYKLADYYERQTELVTKQLTTLIEPLLILGLGLVVGFIVIAMLMPIFQMNMIIQ